MLSMSKSMSESCEDFEVEHSHRYQHTRVDQDVSQGRGALLIFQPRNHRSPGRHSPVRTPMGARRCISEPRLVFQHIVSGLSRRSRAERLYSHIRQFVSIVGEHRIVSRCSKCAEPARPPWLCAMRLAKCGMFTASEAATSRVNDDQSKSITAVHKSGRDVHRSCRNSMSPLP